MEKWGESVCAARKGLRKGGAGVKTNEWGARGAGGRGR